MTTPRLSSCTSSESTHEHGGDLGSIELDDGLEVSVVEEAHVNVILEDVE